MARPTKARQPIKEAAVTLFVEHGIHATGIREIARAAGYSEAALYRHWPSKEAMVADLFSEHLAEVTAIFEDACAKPGSLAERLRAAVHAAYALYDCNPTVFRFVLLQRHEALPHVSPDLRLPHDVIRDLIADEHGPAKADLLLAGAMGTFLQTAEFVHYGRLPGPLARHADDVADMVARLLG